MKVIILTHAISRHADDHPQFINELALAYGSAGHQVRVLTASHCSIDPAKLDPRLDFALYRYAPRRFERLGYGETLRGDLRFRLLPLFFAPLMFVAGVLALRRTIDTFQPDVVHVHWVLPNGPIAALGTWGKSTPYLISFPGSDVTAMGANPIFKWLGRLACRRAFALTANSTDLRDTAVGYGAPREKFSLVLYGSAPDIVPPDPERLAELRRLHGLEDGQQVILAVGRLVAKKGFRYLVEAVPGLLETGGNTPDFKVLILGDGPQRGLLQELIARQGLARSVELVGRIAFRDLPQYYHLADLLAMPAVREPADGLNVVVVEAQKYGLPVAASDVGGNELVVEDGVNGYLCPEKDSQALAGILRQLLEDPARARTLGEHARETFANKGSWDRIVAQYRGIIDGHER